jgi:hypothetical protein
MEGAAGCGEARVSGILGPQNGGPQRAPKSNQQGRTRTGINHWINAMDQRL